MPARTTISIGQRFGKLTVVALSGRDKHRNLLWGCLCDCGGTAVVIANDLKKGHTRSCGCLYRERGTHGKTQSPEYVAWINMKSRCLNPKAPNYRHYGGRGITVAPEWMDFETFLRDLGLRPSARHSLERVNNDLGYAPGNVKWADKLEQTSNTRRNNRLTFRGRTLSVAQWARLLNVNPSTLRFRLRAGWPVESVLTLPVNKRS